MILVLVCMKQAVILFHLQHINELSQPDMINLDTIVQLFMP